MQSAERAQGVMTDRDLTSTITYKRLTSRTTISLRITCSTSSTTACSICGMHFQGCAEILTNLGDLKGYRHASFGPHDQTVGMPDQEKHALWPHLAPWAPWARGPKGPRPLGPLAPWPFSALGPFGPLAPWPFLALGAR